jgi:hypothetical protein
MGSREMISLTVHDDRVLRIDYAIPRPMLFLTHPAAETKVQGDAAGKHQRQDDKQPDEQDSQKGRRGAGQNNEPRALAAQMAAAAGYWWQKQSCMTSRQEFR